MAMPSSSDAPPYHYIAFIDEAGDPGISRVRPLDPVGGSEWLVLGGVLIEAKHELAPVTWVRSILGDIGLERRQELHFRELVEWRKPLVCQKTATFPLNIFAMCSNKKNMRGHSNPRAEAQSYALTPKQYFYNFCLRLILERITDCVLRHSQRAYGGPRSVLIIFSNRGGQKYGHTFAYHERLKNQSRSDTTWLDRRTIKWQVIDRRLMQVLEAKECAGLQLADIVASSFFQAVDILPPTNWNAENAKLLRPRVAQEAGYYHDYGVTFQPIPAWHARLLPRQKEIFEFYGFDGREF
jgi:hypothetical protein